MVTGYGIGTAVGFTGCYVGVGGKERKSKLRLCGDKNVEGREGNRLFIYLTLYGGRSGAGTNGIVDPTSPLTSEHASYNLLAIRHVSESFERREMQTRHLSRRWLICKAELTRISDMVGLAGFRRTSTALDLMLPSAIVEPKEF